VTDDEDHPNAGGDVLKEGERDVCGHPSHVENLTEVADDKDHPSVEDNVLEEGERDVCAYPSRAENLAEVTDDSGGGGVPPHPPTVEASGELRGLPPKIIPTQKIMSGRNMNKTTVYLHNQEKWRKNIYTVVNTHST